MLTHADGERLQAAKDHVAIERARHAAGRLLEEVEPLRERLVLRHGGTEDDVRVPVQVLRGRVHDDGGAEVERALEHRGGEGVVDDDRDAGLPRDLRDLRDVEDLEHREFDWASRAQQIIFVVGLSAAFTLAGSVMSMNVASRPNGFITRSKMRNVPP